MEGTGGPLKVIDPVTGDYEDMKAIAGLIGSKGIFDSQIITRSGKLSEDGIFPKFLWSGMGIADFTKTQIILNHHLANVKIQNLGELDTVLNDDTSNILRISFGITDYVKAGNDYRILNYLFDTDKRPINIFPGCIFNEYIKEPFNIIEIYTLKQSTPENIPFEILLEQSGDINLIKNQVLEQQHQDPPWTPVGDSIWVYYPNGIHVYDVNDGLWINHITTDGITGLYPEMEGGLEKWFYMKSGTDELGYIDRQTGIIHIGSTDKPFERTLIHNRSGSIPPGNNYGKYPVHSVDGSEKFLQNIFDDYIDLFNHIEDSQMDQVVGTGILNTTDGVVGFDVRLIYGINESAGVVNCYHVDSVTGDLTFIETLPLGGIPVTRSVVTTLAIESPFAESACIIPLQNELVVLEGTTTGAEIITRLPLSGIVDILKFETNESFLVLSNNGNRLNYIGWDVDNQELTIESTENLTEPGKMFCSNIEYPGEPGYAYLTNSKIVSKIHDELIEIPLPQSNPLGFEAARIRQE